MSDHVFAQAPARAQPDQAPRASRQHDLPIAARRDRPDRDLTGPTSHYPMRAADFSQVPAQGTPVASIPQAQRWADRFGPDLSSVWLHPESPRAGGRVHAVAEGDHVYFAPGRFAPGTEPGDRLLAHELAHVAQQHRSGPLAPDLAAELDADAAAAAVLRGGVGVQVRAAVGAGRHRYEAWEHRELGDADGGDKRMIRLPNGVELSYGDIVALSGDFYRSPEALLRAPRAELDKILAAMRDERDRLRAHPDHQLTPSDVVDTTVEYDVATRDRGPASATAVALGGDPPRADPRPRAKVPEGGHGEVREGEHVESGAPGAEAGFLALAEANPAHFSPDNIDRNWKPKHQLALDLARKAWDASHPGAVPALDRPDDTARTATSAGLASADPSAPAAEQAEAQAWLAAGFSDHFLTDAFAAGHLTSGDRAPYVEFLRSNAPAIAAACAECAVIDSFFVAGSGLSALMLTFQGILAVKGPGLLLKTVHDYYNSHGIQVRNELLQPWRTYGDSHLAESSDTRAMAKLAVKASRDAVQDVLETGKTERAVAALKYIPAQASLDGVTFKPIADFALDKTVWTPVLSLSLSPNPRTNVLYQLIKRNLALLPKLGAAEAPHWAGKQVGEATDWAGKQVGKATDWVGKQVGDAEAEGAELVGRLEEKILQQYGLH